jgi:hypothetical protein
MSGFSHTEATTYGTANFWQMSDIHIVMTQGVPTMTLTMLGYASQSDAESNLFRPLGSDVFTLTAAQIPMFFASAQTNITGFLTSVWPDAVFVPS